MRGGRPTVLTRHESRARGLRRVGLHVAIGGFLLALIVGGSGAASGPRADDPVGLYADGIGADRVGADGDRADGHGADGDRAAPLRPHDCRRRRSRRRPFRRSRSPNRRCLYRHRRSEHPTVPRSVGPDRNEPVRQRSCTERGRIRGRCRDRTPAPRRRLLGPARPASGIGRRPRSPLGPRQATRARHRARLPQARRPAPSAALAATPAQACLTEPGMPVVAHAEAEQGADPPKRVSGSSTITAVSRWRKCSV